MDSEIEDGGGGGREGGRKFQSAAVLVMSGCNPFWANQRDIFGVPDCEEVVRPHAQRG
jgi:hypothetical protein